MMAHWSGDYPRVCGGTLEKWGVIERSEGLSPRVRGHRKKPFIAQ